jgi:hypothetical protein
MKEKERERELVSCLTCNNGTIVVTTRLPIRNVVKRPPEAVLVTIQPLVGVILQARQHSFLPVALNINIVSRPMFKTMCIQSLYCLIVENSA